MKRKIYGVFFLILILNLFSIQNNSYAIDDKIKNAQSDLLSKDVVYGIAVAIGSQNSYKSKIASTLQKVGKNLILENTRGTKEINAYQKVAPAVVFVLTEIGFGSGAIIDPNGLIITNWHVVKNYSDVVVVFKPKDSTELKKELAFTAKVVKTDPVSDLALLRLHNSGQSVRYMQLGDPKKITIGQDVHAIGHPEGEIWTYTKGIISQIRSGYKWTTEEGINHHAKVIQTQTPISTGSSGGPLFDDAGTLLGINSFIRKGGNINYAVAVDEIRKFLTKKENLKKESSESAEEPKCLESFDTKGEGWSNIEGCLFFSDKLPPDFWIVYDDPNKPASYIAMITDGHNQINTVTISKENKWQELAHLMDTDCDGIIDLIGLQQAGKEEIASYSRPKKTLYTKSLTKELDQALKTGKIPYPQIRVCQ